MARTVDPMRIVVLGYIVRWPMGGIAWHHLQYVMGLAKLGHDVVFMEDGGDDDWSCYDPSTGSPGSDPTYGLRFATTVFDRVGLSDHWCFYDAHRKQWFGPAADRALRFCEHADLLLNVTEVNVMRPWYAAVPKRALIDTDPVFNQIHHLTQDYARSYALEHTSFFSFGENICSGTSTAPEDGLPWQATRQPVAIDAWPAVPGRPEGLFRTVMQWESYPTLEYRGVAYGTKAISFGSYVDLPARVGPCFELALGSPHAPRTELAAKGWKLTDPLAAAPDPWAYQRYIQESKAEFSVAKHAYHSTNSGWFSERSAVFLASGRPVVVQETGFSEWMGRTPGVLPFSNVDEAAAAIEEVTRNYDVHCRAAREVARELFDSDTVLASLVERAIE